MQRALSALDPSIDRHRRGNTNIRPSLRGAGIKTMARTVPTLGVPQTE
jgi:hypothetical protein